ncbi:uncharacterized protein B0H64DRAFT_54679 [Chaetomium fimeti]|uniref:Uncharacterized protein n=1 Tax=Chaetomium fimeti TaxID=1854472 RepID=A0AAE0H6D9_9PEZI|nr:hypothetical protein B0H64DRAFT_54679 [Chaetomium fimeti]
MAQQPSLSSNNPFRRKDPGLSAPAAPPAGVPRFAEFDETPSLPPALPPADLFRHQLQSLSSPDQPPPATSFQKPKVVKKVRVQSPPPSSPDSPGIPQRFPPVDVSDDDSSSSDETYEQIDPFTYPSSTGSADVSDTGDEPQSIPTHRTPPNPFQKTLKDLEAGVTEPEQNSETASGTKGGLDVGAFGRLLLTGQAAGSTGPSQATAPYAQHNRHPPIPSGDGASTADTSSASRQSISDTLQAVQETPQTSRETSEHGGEDDRGGLVSNAPAALQPAPAIVKKKPPPPSSRHGKLIKPGSAGEAKGTPGGAPPPSPGPNHGAATLPPVSPSKARPVTPSGVNKPLPLAPKRSPAEEDAESVFDREAAGKTPEPEVQPGLNIVMPPRPPTPPNVSHATSNAVATAAQPVRKPAPPPRRQPHGRSDSRGISGAASAAQHDETEFSHRRSSVDSTRSRSSSLRVSIHAPAPPPPRRPSHHSRGSSSHGMPPPGAPPVDAAAEPSPLSGPIVASPPQITSDPSSSNSTPRSTTPAPASTSTPSPAGAGPPVPVPAAIAKLAPPPPPPARNTSVRGKRPARTTLPTPPRDAGVLPRRSSGGGNRAGKEPPPPPTRHRDRGSSHGSADGGGGGGGGGGDRGGLGGTGGGGGGAVGDRGGLGDPGDASHGVGDILADLDALQREVDALRGQVGRE